MGQVLPTDKHHAWVRDALSADPESYSSAAGPQAAPPPAAAPAPGAAPPPAAPAAATPDQAKADLERRLAQSGPLYAKYGPAADNMVKPEDRLTPAELQVGNVTVARTGDTALDGKDSRTKVDEKGITTSSTASVTQGEIGPDGKAATFSREHTDTTNYGLLNKTETHAATTTTQAGGVTTVDGNETSSSVDLLKGERSSSTGTSSSETNANTGASSQHSDKTTTTMGVGGYSQTHEETHQTGDKFDSTSTTAGVTRSDGQIGIGGSRTVKSGTMTGPADKQEVKEGSETTAKGSLGLVSDDKGVGLGANAGVDHKRQMDDGLSLTGAIGGGGRCQTKVAEVANSDPPMFTVTTTISLEFSIGAGGGQEGVSADGQSKGSVSIGMSASMAQSASFTHTLKAEDAKAYLEAIRNNGRGGKLPEHQVLATGMSEGWKAAAELWAKMSGGAAAARALKPGEELETASQSGASGKIGASGGESGKGGLTVGAEYAKSGSHTVDVKRKALADGRVQITASIDDQTDTAIGGSVGIGAASGKAGTSHGEGSGLSVVLVLDPNDPKFDAIIGEIEAAKTGAELQKVAAAHKDMVSSSTAKTSGSDGTSAGLSVAGVSLDGAGKGTITNEVTTDADGNVIATKSVGTSQTGGSAGIGGVKVSDSKTDSYTGAVQHDQASGEVAQTTSSTNVGQTLKNLAAGMVSDPLGTVAHPSQAVASDTNMTGIAIADAETMDICYAALNEPKWNGKCASPRRMPEWKAAGAKIRAALTLKDGEIVAVNKPAVQKALAEWSKGDDGGRAEVLESVIRPQGGTPGGKAEAFPGDTARMKPEFDALVNADPLADAKEKAKTDPQAALKDMQAVRARVRALQSMMNSEQNSWAGDETQFAEMVGNLNARASEADKAVNELETTLRKAAQAAQHQQETTSSAEQEAARAAEEKAEKDREYTDKMRGQLEAYNNNIDSLKHYSETVFAKLGEAEAILRKDGLFDNKTDNVVAASKILKETDDLIKIWDQKYWPSYQMYEELVKVFTNLDKSRLERLHVAGAQARWQEVHRLST